MRAYVRAWVCERACVRNRVRACMSVPARACVSALMRVGACGVRALSCMRERACASIRA